MTTTHSMADGPNQQHDFFCFACHSDFTGPEPDVNSGNDAIICPHCGSDFCEMIENPMDDPRNQAIGFNPNAPPPQLNMNTHPVSSSNNQQHQQSGGILSSLFNAFSGALSRATGEGGQPQNQPHFGYRILNFGPQGIHMSTSLNGNPASSEFFPRQGGEEPQQQQQQQPPPFDPYILLQRAMQAAQQQQQQQRQQQQQHGIQENAPTGSGDPLAAILQQLLPAMGIVPGENGIGSDPNNYAFGGADLDRIITQLMEQVGGQPTGSTAPPPMQEDAIDRLPKFTYSSIKHAPSVEHGRDPKVAAEKEQEQDTNTTTTNTDRPTSPSPIIGVDNDCPICKEAYKDGDQLIRLPNCNHTFHLECIRHWLSITNSCPICRQNIETSPPSSTATSSSLGQEPLD